MNYGSTFIIPIKIVVVLLIVLKNIMDYFEIIFVKKKKIIRLRSESIACDDDQGKTFIWSLDSSWR